MKENDRSVEEQIHRLYTETTSDECGPFMTPDLKQLMDAFQNDIEGFVAHLTADEWIIWERLNDTRRKREKLSEQELFSYAFRLGVLSVLLTTTPRAFHTYDDRYGRYDRYSGYDSLDGYDDGFDDD